MLLSTVSNSLDLYFYLREGDFLLLKVLVWSLYLPLTKNISLLCVKSGALNPRGQPNCATLPFLFGTLLLGSQVPNSSIS